MILAFESSCDESAIAAFDPALGILGDWVHSQIDLHRAYGGVVPDLASREHLERFGPLLELARSEVDFSRVTRVAVTCGPGLAGCLAMGIASAKAIALEQTVPLVGVNHLRGHAFSPLIGVHRDSPDAFEQNFKQLCPHLGLLVSGGNTVLFRLEADRSVEILAETVDDAAGEALDKGAKLLGMPYPGGALIEQAAEGGDTRAFAFPSGIPERSDMRFSFSGLKTSLRYRLEKMTDAELEAAMRDICASYQDAVVRQLVTKTRHALDSHTFHSLGLSGGVANNSALRAALDNLAQDYTLPLLSADKRYTGDNAAMVAFAAWVDPAGCIPANGLQLQLDPSWRLNRSPNNT